MFDIMLYMLYSNATQDAMKSIKEAFKEVFGEDQADLYLSLVDAKLQDTIQSLQKVYTTNMGSVAHQVIDTAFCKAKEIIENYSDYIVTYNLDGMKYHFAVKKQKV